MGSLDCFFRPRSIAIVGASRSPGRPGHTLVENLRATFAGRLYPVNPQAGEIAGLAAFARVGDIPEAVDLAVVLVGAEHALRAVEECAAKGVKGVIVEAAGFAEIGPSGRAVQEAMTAAARRAGMRLWGPNCLGLIDPRAGVFTSYMPINKIEPGGVSLVTQSGAIAGGLLLQVLEERMFSVNKVCSIGNKADVDECELLEHLAGDEATRVVAMYLESIDRGRRFVEAAKAISRQKPIIVLKSGRTAQGIAASLSHTASLTGDERVVNAAFAEAGIVRADDIGDFLALAKAFEGLARRRGGRRVAVVSTTGAGGVLAADQIGLHALDLARLGAATMHRLGELYPPWTPADQPLDVSPTILKVGVNRALEHALSAVLADDGVDAVLLQIYGMPPSAGLDAAAVAGLVAGSGKPAVVWLYGMGEYLRPWRLAFEGGGLPVMPDLRTAARALQALAEWTEYRERPQERLPRSGPPPATARSLLRPKAAAGRPLPTVAAAFRLLEAYGIPVARGALASGAASAVEAAGRLGFPVAVKAADARLAHKSDLGCVRLGIATKAQVRAAVSAIRRALPAGIAADVFVQEMVTGGLEMIVGGVRDPQFGPAVMLGVGGIWVETLGDVAFRLAPLGRREAEGMIRSLRAHPLLGGSRGQPKLDLAALSATLVAVGRLMTECPEVASLDINPFMLLPEGRGGRAVDALIELR